MKDDANNIGSRKLIGAELDAEFDNDLDRFFDPEFDGIPPSHQIASAAAWAQEPLPESINHIAAAVKYYISELDEMVSEYKVDAEGYKRFDPDEYNRILNVKIPQAEQIRDLHGLGALKLLKNLQVESELKDSPVSVESDEPVNAVDSFFNSKGYAASAGSAELSASTTESKKFKGPDF